MLVLRDALPYAPYPLPAVEWPGIATAVSAIYRAAATWEEYKQGDYQTTTITRQVAFGVQPQAEHYEVEVRVAQTTLQKDDPEPLEELAVRLAALYERIVLTVGPAGQLRSLLNHEELRRRWEALKTDLRQASSEDDQITGYLVGYLDQQLQDPANLLQSLRFDYLYPTLFRLLSKPAGAGDGQGFPQFFEGCGLWFSEQLTQLPGEAPDRATLVVRGTLDKQRTDVGAVEQQIRAALATSLLGTPAADLPTPHFGYLATYVMEQPTGLPVRIELTVYARLGELYNKEYTLLLNRL